MEGSGVMKVDGGKLRVAVCSGLGRGHRPVHQLEFGGPALKGLRSISVRLLMIAFHRDLLSIKGKPFPIPECERRPS